MSKRNFVIHLGLVLLILLFPHIPAGQAATFYNPLGDNFGPVQFISKVIRFLLGLIGLLALLAIIVGGIRMVISFGNDQAVASAKNIIKWAIIGLIIAILSWVIVRILTTQLFGIQF